MAKIQRYALNKNKYLIETERERLEYLLKSRLISDARNCSLLLTGLHTGARALEILNLKWEDLNLNDETVFIRGIKNSNDREIPLPRWFFRDLQKIERQNEMIFPISYNRLRQIWHLYRPVHKKFHCLRHTFAIRLYQKTKDIRLVQVALGHRSITNTMIYADYIYSREELRKLIL